MLGAFRSVFFFGSESGFKDVVLINGAYGLGELVVGEKISPTEFFSVKPTLQKGSML